jgi:predicted MPP superfamily phosphohydrolase
MLFIAALFSIEILVLLTLREIFYSSSRLKFYLSLAINLSLSFWVWYLFIWIKSYRGPFDNPENVRHVLYFNGLLCGVMVPRFILIMFHYTGKLFRIRKGGYKVWLSVTGFVISCLIFIIVALGTFRGRYNFKNEEITVKVKSLPPGLDGLKIVQLSDLHLVSFYKNHERLQKLMDRINSFQPDLVLNTGDFVTYGWREFDRCDTILSKAKSRYGNFAILGNHDMGTYFPGISQGDRDIIILKINDLIRSSGYHVLYESNEIVEIRGVKVEIIGVSTAGRHPNIIHGNLNKAMANTDSSDFKILLCHDPDQWDEDVRTKSDIDLTFAGHTHGMQMGIMTKKFRWSPAQYLFKHWAGLYSENGQTLYVNRGLGVLAIPFRTGMPPEITVLTLNSD